MNQPPKSSVIHALTLEYKNLQEEPVEGFRVQLIDDENMFEWMVTIFGPPNTIYQGGYFKAIMKFPIDYPYNPPSLRFITKFWHPNVYKNGKICISILHPPVPDPLSSELACERWNPTQCVRTVLLSVIALMNEPNTFSPANVDASVMYRKWIETNGEDKDYVKIVSECVASTREDAAVDGIVVPTTIEDYCLFGKKPMKQKEPEPLDIMDTYDVDYCEDGEDENLYEEEEDDEEGNSNAGDYDIDAEKSDNHDS